MATPAATGAAGTANGSNPSVTPFPVTAAFNRRTDRNRQKELP